MSIRHGLLALLAQGPRYGYQLRAEFEALTASGSLNIGQVYSTLARLERDGLALRDGADGEGRFVYRITRQGIAEVDRWFLTPIVRGDRTRDELAVKLALALTTPGANVAEIVRVQRTATLHALGELDIQRQLGSERDRDVAWSLVLQSRILQTEAELRWLDHCEESLLARSM
jgi:DNA-binding PadR family transcriptional regulator